MRSPTVLIVDFQVATHYRLDLAALDQLERRVVDDYEPEQWGISRFRAIEDVEERAVASDLLISLCEGAKTALLDLAIASQRYTDLLGPNGRTMPGPETRLAERVELAQMDGASTECFRALGSTLDCLAGLSVLIIGMPLSVQRAEGSWLLRRPNGRPAPHPQEERWNSIVAAVSEQADIFQPGWLAWALEARNAVVHRGQLLRVWLNRPSQRRPGNPQFLVRTRTPAQYLIRVEQHLRRRPWLPDMHALVGGRDINELWLTEPAQVTLDDLRRRVSELAAAVASSLADTWDTAMATFEWPVESWQLDPRGSGWRIELAERFAGFEPSYPVPPPDQIRMHGDSAKRPALAQRLRQER